MIQKLQISFETPKYCSKILFAKSIIQFEEETYIFDIMRNLFKLVFVKPRFCMRVKNEGPRDFIRYKEEFIKNHVR